MRWREVWLQFSCNVMGWHRMKLESMTLAGVNVTGVCRRCDIPVMLDSQGNAFAVITLNEHNQEDI